MEDSKRLGFVGIVIEERSMSEKVNRILSQYGDIIRGRIGVPDQSHNHGVIGIIIEGTCDEVGSMTGKLGNLQGVTVKSALISKKKEG